MTFRLRMIEVVAASAMGWHFIDDVRVTLGVLCFLLAHVISEHAQ